MTAPAPPDQTRPTRHRAEPSTPDVLRRFAPPLVAVAAVAIVILLLVVLNSRPSAPGPAPGAVAQPPTSATQPPLSSPPVLTSPTAAVTTPATVAPPPVSQPPATQPPAVAKAPVTVLNNSRRAGLAKHVADEVRAKGWPVQQTGNFRGRIALTTLYYAVGQQAQAEALARAMPQIKRVEPRFAGLPGSGLTLVVTRDWSS